MAHELTQRKNGFIEFAATGKRSEVWHGLGQYLEVGADMETWRKAAGMDWEIFSSAVQYQAGLETLTDTSRQVLFRSDSKDVLSVVSKDYKIVQPAEVLDFFKEFTDRNQMQLSAAGTLFGGKRFWAIAELGKETQIVEGDTVKGYLLLTTSADGTLSTQAKFTSVRVVCNNTLSVSLSERGGKVVRCTHAREFDAKQFKVDLGLIDTQWEGFIGNLREMANQRVDEDAAKGFFDLIVNPGQDSAERQKLGYQRQFDALMHFYKHGAGAEMSHGTKWGLLNAVTEMQTHGAGRATRDAQFDSSEFGKAASFKLQAYNELVDSLT